MTNRAVITHLLCCIILYLRSAAAEPPCPLVGCQLISQPATFFVNCNANPCQFVADQGNATIYWTCSTTPVPQNLSFQSNDTAVVPGEAAQYFSLRLVGYANRPYEPEPPLPDRNCSVFSMDVEYTRSLGQLPPGIGVTLISDAQASWNSTVQLPFQLHWSFGFAPTPPPPPPGPGSSLTGWRLALVIIAVVGGAITATVLAVRTVRKRRLQGLREDEDTDQAQQQEQQQRDERSYGQYGAVSTGYGPIEEL